MIRTVKYQHLYPISRLPREFRSRGRSPVPPGGGPEVQIRGLLGTEVPGLSHGGGEWTEIDRPGQVPNDLEVRLHEPDPYFRPTYRGCKRQFLRRRSVDVDDQWSGTRSGFLCLHCSRIRSSSNLVRHTNTTRVLSCVPDSPVGRTGSSSSLQSFRSLSSPVDTSQTFPLTFQRRTYFHPSLDVRLRYRTCCRTSELSQTVRSVLASLRLVPGPQPSHPRLLP